MNKIFDIFDNFEYFRQFPMFFNILKLKYFEVILVDIYKKYF